MNSTSSTRHFFVVVAHNDKEHFNVFLRSDRFYVGTPNIGARKLARWKDRVPSPSRSGGTATLRPCCDSVTRAEAEDVILAVWLDVKYPRLMPPAPLDTAQHN